MMKTEEENTAMGIVYRCDRPSWYGVGIREQL